LSSAASDAVSLAPELVRRPHRIRVIFCADWDRACLKERFEHAEFLGREIELSSVAACRARDLVKLDSRRAQGAALGSGLTAGERADTEDELGE
jgi:hypothetical protein